MTVPLLDEAPPDDEDFVVCWLQPLLVSSVERETDDLPYAGVQHVDGASDPDCGTEDSVVQVDILGLGVAAAKIAANRVQRRMELLFWECSDVVMSDGRTANCDFGRTLMRPKRMPYAHEQIVRFVARYELGLSYVTVT